MSFKKEHRQETIIYLGLWGIIFMAPVLSLSIRANLTNDAFDWADILMVWREFLPFFAVFLIHNHLMAPMLVYQQRKAAYIGISLAIVVIFQVYQCNHRPKMMMDRGPHPEMTTDGHRPPMPPDARDHDFDGPPPRPHERDSLFPLNDSTAIAKYDPRDYRPRPFRDRRPDEKHPPVMIGQHDVIALIILFLMLGMNLGVKLYFKQRGDRKRLEELERQNLEQQLEYLKYQINPHFLMNTLNNIHALVDIDPEKSKQTILELSKMMRFVLYEGHKTGVPLDREIAFLQNYITLMKLRYTDKVSITVDVPKSLPSSEVPPLMFITFVENAFKHGVSYRQESFINVAVRIEESRLVFVCKNSRIPKEEDKHGGVGLANVKQRLDLIYGKDYALDIKDEPDVYTVTLTIPL